MRHVRLHSLASICGVILALLIVNAAGSFEFIQSSDVIGGGTEEGPPWWVVPLGTNCGTTIRLTCPMGQTYGYQVCGGGEFTGVTSGNNGVSAHTDPPRYAFCTSTVGAQQTGNCPMVWWTRCKPYD